MVHRVLPCVPLHQLAISDCDDPEDQEFRDFLNLIGTVIKLKDWDGFRAGLDVEGWCAAAHIEYSDAFVPFASSWWNW